MCGPLYLAELRNTMFPQGPWVPCKGSLVAWLLVLLLIHAPAYPHPCGCHALGGMARGFLKEGFMCFLQACPRPWQPS